MRQAGLSGLVPKRRGRTTIRVPGVRVADDLVGRQFRPAAPNVLWLADITYLEPGSAPGPPEKSFAARSLTASGSSTTPAPGRSLCADRMLGCRFPVRRRESKILRRTRGKGVGWIFGYALTLGGPSFRLQRMAGVPRDLHGHRDS